MFTKHKIYDIMNIMTKRQAVKYLSKKLNINDYVMLCVFIDNLNIHSKRKCNKFIKIWRLLCTLHQQ